MQDNRYRSAIDILRRKREEIRKNYSEIFDELDSIEAAIAELSKNGNPSAERAKPEQSTLYLSFSSDYDRDWHKPQKVLYIISTQQRFLHFREIAYYYAIAEGEPTDIDNLILLASSLSSACKVHKKRGTIVKYEASKKAIDTFWGLPDWLDSLGKIKKGYFYNQNLNFEANSIDDMFGEV